MVGFRSFDAVWVGVSNIHSCSRVYYYYSVYLVVTYLWVVTIAFTGTNSSNWLPEAKRNSSISSDISPTPRGRENAWDNPGYANISQLSL